MAACAKHPGPCRRITLPRPCPQPQGLADDLPECLQGGRMRRIFAEVLMHSRRLAFVAAILAFIAILATSSAPRAQDVALTGQATSAEEGAMQGVLVSAKKANSTITVTVVPGDLLGRQQSWRFDCQARAA